MVEKKMHTEVLLELLLKASSYDKESQIHNQCLPLYLRKLNCFSASIIKKGKRLYKDVFHMPIAAQKWGDWLEVKNHFAYAVSIQPNAVNEYGTKDGFYYAFDLSDNEMLILGRKKAFSKAFYFDLIPIISHLGKQLQQARKSIEREFAAVALQDSERRLQMSLEVNHSSVFENDFQTGLANSTPDLYHFLGYQTSEVPTSIDGLTALIHPDDVELVMAAFQNHVEGKHKQYYAEFRMKTKKGKWNWVDGRGRIISRDKEGNPIKMLGISQDVSKRKAAEEELVKAKDKAENSDRLKSAFLANMSHEIRTPMNGILGFADLLKQPKLDGEEQKEYVTIIERSGLRLLSIINDLVDISKIESGQMELNYEDTDVIRQVKYIKDFFKLEAYEKGIDLIAIVPNLETKVVVCTDREKLYAILINLVKNAIKYTNAGEIKFGFQETEHNYQFFVSDTGIGIDKDKQESVFNRFIQLDNPKSTAQQGSGLGLSIAKAYVEMLKGRIWFENNSEKGTCFYFTLPKIMVQ